MIFLIFFKFFNKFLSVALTAIISLSATAIPCNSGELPEYVYLGGEPFGLKMYSDGVMIVELESYFDGSKVLVHLTFLGNADEPVVARLIKNYGVDVNIIQGKIDYLKDLPYGTLLVEISGTKECLAKALEYIHQAKVKEEVIGYVS